MAATSSTTPKLENDVSGPELRLCLIAGALAGLLGGALVGATIGLVLAWDSPVSDRLGSAELGAGFGACPGLFSGVIASAVYYAAKGRRGALLAGVVAGLINPLLWSLLIYPRVTTFDVVIGLMPMALGIAIAVTLDVVYRRYVSNQARPVT